MDATVGVKSPPSSYNFNTSPSSLRFKQKSVCPGKVKLELWYETLYATHVASRVIKASSAYEGPFIESICVFVEPNKAFDMVEAYWDLFEELRDDGLVPQDATLQGFDIIIEDQLTQAWVAE